MPIKIDTDEYLSKNNSSEFRAIIKENQIKKWFFCIGFDISYVVIGTYHNACESVKKYFKTSYKASYGIIKLSKIEDIN